MATAKRFGTMAQIFLGNEQMKVDTKGRVGIPSRFMQVLRSTCPDHSESVGLMITPERSIRIMPMPVFIEEVERWSGLDDLDQKQRMIKNLVTSTAELVALDRQNRIKLNPLMMEFCGISQQVVIVGNIHYMQLFDLEQWKSMFKDGLGKLGGALDELARQEKPAPKRPIKQFVINVNEEEGSEAESRSTHEHEE